MPVDINLLVDDANAIAGQADDALDVVRMIVERKFEDDNVAAANGPVGQKLFVPGAGAFEHEFIHEQMVADQKRRLHRLRRDFEGLHDESGAEESEQNRDQKRLDEVAQTPWPLRDDGRRGRPAEISADSGD